MAALTQNVTYAFRRLMKSPGFTAAAVVSIGLGIAANATIFSMVSTFVLRPAPVGDAATMVSLYTKKQSGDCCSNFSYPQFEDIRDQMRSFSSVSAYFPLLPASIGGRGEPERVWGQLVSANYFQTAQLKMTVGRGFTSDEERVPAVVLSHALWQRRFGGDAAIVGQAVPVSGRPFTVVGVAPAGYRGLDLGFESELWVPIGMSEQLMPKLGNRSERTHSWLDVTARIKPGVSREQAEAELQVLAKRLAAAHPESEKDRAFQMNPAGAVHPAMKNALLMFLGALSVVVLLVLLIACANVANLLLAQASARQREMAVRLAMGATRWQLMRQMLTESLIVSLAGGLFGVLLSVWATQALSSFHLPIPFPLDLRVGVDWKVLAYTFLLSLGTGLLFGLAPALAASRPILTAALKGEDVLSKPGRKWTMRNVLVVAQVAMSLTLLCATGLFLRSLQSAAGIDIGFRGEGITMMAVDPALHGYSPERTVRFLDSVKERVSRLPGVQSVAVTDIVPLSIGGTSNGVGREGAPNVEGGQRQSADFYMVSSDYFTTLGIGLVAGRDFGGETAASQKVAVVNEAFVQKVLGGGNPIGQRVTGGSEVYEVIGVVKNAKSRTLGENQKSMLYRSLAQEVGLSPSFMGYSLLVRGSGDVAAMVRREIQQMDAGLAIFSAETMEEHLKNALFLPRLAGTLFGVFGGVGLLLAAVGLYGVMSYSVSRRTREIGIRIALGAEAGGVQRMVVRQGLILTGIAMVVGLTAALASAKLASGILYGVQPHDLATFTGVPAFLGVVAFLATWVPARRASRVDPMTALRHD